MKNEDKNKINKTLSIYRKYWINQDRIFKKLGEDNPYLSPEFIDISKLTSSEKETLKKLSNGAESEIFIKVNKLLKKRFTFEYKEELDLEEAKKKLQVDLVDEIPFENTCSLEEFYYSFLPFSQHQLNKKEFIWLYKKGYIPHLYLKKNKPRFDKRMWFIIDFVLRKARQEIGFGIFKTFSSYQPEPHLLRNYILLTNYMFNSWNIGVAIFNYAERKAKEQKIKGESFKITTRGLIESLWTREGKIIADNLIQKIKLISNFNLIEYYRDIFALFSFEAFPVIHLIDLYHNDKQRAGVILIYERFANLSVHNMGLGNINTSNQKRLAKGYEILFHAVDWVLSMKEGVINRKVIDIVDKYRWQENNNKLIPCRICGEPFKPRRPKKDVTCGKPECIKKNKYLSQSTDFKYKLSPLILKEII